MENGVASIAFSTSLVFSYLKMYSPDTALAFVYPEGKYGPPLLREQFVATTVFSLLTSIAGFILVTCLRSTCLLFNQERLNVEQQIKQSASRLIATIPIVIGSVLVLYMGVMAIFGPTILRLSRLILKNLMPYTHISFLYELYF